MSREARPGKSPERLPIEAAHAVVGVNPEQVALVTAAARIAQIVAGYYVKKTYLFLHRVSVSVKETGLFFTKLSRYPPASPDSPAPATTPGAGAAGAPGLQQLARAADSKSRRKTPAPKKKSRQVAGSFSSAAMRGAITPLGPSGSVPPRRLPRATCKRPWPERGC